MTEERNKMRVVDWAMLAIVGSAALYGFNASEGFRSTFDQFRQEMKDSFVTKDLFSEKIDRLREAVERGDGSFSRNLEARVGTLETRVTLVEKAVAEK